VRDRFVLEKSPTYWDHDTVGLDRVILYSIDNLATSANMYRAGSTDLVVGNDFPPAFIPTLRSKKDLFISASLQTYFYRVNVTRPPLNDPRVRLALDLAINKAEIVKIKGAGEVPAATVVPPGLPGYVPPAAPGYDPAEARRVLAEAGYPGGKGFPSVSLLYNSSEVHRLIAAAVQAQWREVLGVHIELENKEWKTYLKSMNSLDYDIVRAGWIGDYLDPNTFLDLWITNGGNNNTGWSNAEYDGLIRGAAVEVDPARRMTILRDAEALLVKELPIIPIYFNVWAELRKPYVHGWSSNIIDKHPWKFLSIDLAEANRLAGLEG
jgi:ABC-type oligopeptide transport system substrate-binding subunit